MARKLDHDGADGNGKDVLRPAAAPKSTTLCPGWFFGGPHQWNIGIPRCIVVRQQKPPYQHKTTAYHEWENGRCIHCKKTKVELQPKPSPTDTCRHCGATREQVKLQARSGVQPTLGCEDYGHVVPRKARRPSAVLRVVVDNTKNAGLSGCGLASQSETGRGDASQERT